MQRCNVFILNDSIFTFSFQLGIFSGFMLMLVLELYSNHSEMERIVDLQVGVDHFSLDKEVTTEIFDAVKTDILEMDVMDRDTSEMDTTEANTIEMSQTEVSRTGLLLNSEAKV